jgi:DNA-directed RNA polymerase subunit beta
MKSTSMVKPVVLGKNVRQTFSKINEVIDMPNLIEIQKDSYKWFVTDGLKEVFRDMAAITDYSGNLQLSFVDFRFDEKPKYDVTECKARDATYAAPLRVTARLVNNETGEIKESEVSLGDFPIMTESGTFVINGAERAVVSQLVRSPGVYYAVKIDEKTGKKLYSSTIIPNRGAWLEYETSVNDVLYVRIDKNRKLPLTTFIRSLGVETNAQIRELFGEDERLAATLDADDTKNVEEALVEVYKKLRPSEPVTIEGAKNYIEQLFYDPHRYDISRVGRYKYNKKLAIGARIVGTVLSRPVIDTLTGEIIADADTTVTKELANLIETKGINNVYVNVTDHEGNVSEVKVLSNGMVNLADYTDFTAEELAQLDELGINEQVSFNVLNTLIENSESKEDLFQAILDNADIGSPWLPVVMITS